MPENLQKLGLIDPGDAVPSTEVTPEKPFNECVLCTFCQSGCSGPNLLVTEIERICELMQARRIALRWSYQKLADKADMQVLTVKNILTGKIKNPSFISMQKLAFALFADKDGKFPCPKQLLMSQQDSVEVERLKESLADEKQKVAYLKQQVADYKAMLEERKGYLKLKDKWIITFAVSFAIALLYIIFTLIVDFADPHLGMYWRDVSTLISGV